MNHRSVNWLSKLGAGFLPAAQCRRPRTPHVSAWEERRSTAHNVWWTNFQVERFSDKTVSLCTVQVDGYLADPCVCLFSSCLDDDFAYQRHVTTPDEAQRSITSTKYNKALSRAFLARARSANYAPLQIRFAVGGQVMHWRGNNKRQSQWVSRQLETTLNSLGAQMFWNSPRHRLRHLLHTPECAFAHITRHTNDSTTLACIHANFPPKYANTTIYDPSP